MLASRYALIAIGLSWGIWNAVAAVQDSAFIAIFAVLNLACVAWFWRKDSIVSALASAPIFAIELLSARTWEHTMYVTRVCGMALAAAGLVAVAAVVATRALDRRARPATA
jgi:Zn-dependent protease with chaperone function